MSSCGVASRRNSIPLAGAFAVRSNVANRRRTWRTTCSVASRGNSKATLSQFPTRVSTSVCIDVHVRSRTTFLLTTVHSVNAVAEAGLLMKTKHKSVKHRDKSISFRVSFVLCSQSPRKTSRSRSRKRT